MSQPTPPTQQQSQAQAQTKKNANTERRNTRRQAVSLPCCIRGDGRLRSMIGRTRNVSLSGALVQMPPAPMTNQLSGTTPTFQAGDVVHMVLVPPATGLVGAGELKPAKIIRVDESVRGTVCLALHWAVEDAPQVLGEVLADDEPLPLAA